MSGILMIVLWLAMFLSPVVRGENQSPATEVEKQNKVMTFLLAQQSGLRPGQQFVIPEEDLNEFIREEIRLRRIGGIESISVHLLDQLFKARIAFDSEKLPLGDSVAEGLLKGMLSGTQILEVEGLVEGDEGMGRYETKNASLNGFPLPASLVEVLVSALGKRQDPPFDPSKPFNLPKGVKSLKLRKGAVTLTS